MESWDLVTRQDQIKGEYSMTHQYQMEGQDFKTC